MMLCKKFTGFPKNLDEKVGTAPPAAVSLCLIKTSRPPEARPMFT